MAGSTTDQTETVTQEGALLPGRRSARAAVLLVVGHAGDGGGPSGGERVIPFEDSLEIGRDPKRARGAVPCCLADPCVSSRHTSVTRMRKDCFRVADLRSKNGTLVEGQPIAGHAEVSDGTLLFVGGHALVLRLLSPESLAAIREDLAAPLGPVPTLSPVMAAKVRRLRRLAATDQAILLAGETGVGKGVYARAVHQASRRRGDFVVVDCAAADSERLEAELFGTVGFARGKDAGKRPLVAQAQDGTLFLDKIDEMPAHAQARLLRFLDDRRYFGPGGGAARTAALRVIAAMSSLAHDPSADGLRRDLFARFGPEPIVLPPLRDRREDVGSLCRHFLNDRP